MANTLTLVGEQLALNYTFTTTSVTRPTVWYVALHTGANGGTGANNEITTGEGYARQSVTFSLSSNVITNTAMLTFGPDTTTAWGTVTDITVWDAVTAGRCLAQGTAAASVTYAVGDSATIAIGALSVTLV
jgi:hypothetical protein